MPQITRFEILALSIVWASTMVFREDAVKNTENPIQPNDDTVRSDFKVPSDFPLPETYGAVSGAHAKMLLVKYGEKFYRPGCTPPEVFFR
jgi:hypothetical protein